MKVHSILIALGIATASLAGRAGADGLPDYPREADLLVDTPGTTSSIAGGLWNPASWGMQRGGGLFLAWDDVRGDLSRDAFTGVASFHHLAFGMRQFQHEPAADDPFHVRDYQIGIDAGNRSMTWGLSYGWGGGDLERAPRHERMTLGSVTRCRFASLGAAFTRDLEVDDNLLQADLGIRPLGPRLTLFGDAVYRHGQSFDDIESGYGAEFKVWPGLALAAKGRSTGEISLRLSIALDPYTDLSWRPHLDDAGDRYASTYALEVGARRSHLGQRSVGRGRMMPEMSLRGPIVYQRYQWFDTRRTLLATLERIQQVADDERAGGIVLDLSGAELGGEMAWEIRTQLAALRARGKKVVVYIDRGALYATMLASVADQVWMDPEGILDVRGLTLGRTYMRHAIDKAGLGVDEWRFFTYKSAFEGYSRDSMSEPDREQRQALVDDFYNTAMTAITEARGLEPGAWDRIANEKGVLLPEEAVAAGLVDSIGTWEQAKRSARNAPRRAAGAGDASLLANVTGDPVWGPEWWGEPPRIAVLYAIGPCEMETGIRGRVLSKEIRKARSNRHVKAVVLRVDSPGGDPLPSDLVARELRETAARKPVIVSQGQVAASGGYWVSMFADTIVASPLSVTGSIGVIGGWVWNKEFGDKVGLTYDHVQRGDHSDLGTGFKLPYIGVVVPERPLSPEERDRMESIIRTEYKDFVAKVARGRGLDEKVVDSIGQGRAWSGTRGRDNGLVDEMGGLWRSLQIARAAAALPVGSPVQFPEGPKPGFLDASMFKPKLFGALLGEMPASASSAVAPGSSLSADELDYLRSLVRSQGRPLVRMEPFEIQDGSTPP
jgi:protease-4